MPRPRIQTLSDLIFGLALSIGALSLISEKPADLLSLGNSLLGFGFAFAILAMIWVRYTRIMSVLPVEGGSVLRVNLLMLFLVSVEPYLFNLVTSSGELGSGVASGGEFVDDIAPIQPPALYLPKKLTMSCAIWARLGAMGSEPTCTNMCPMFWTKMSWVWSPAAASSSWS